MSREKGQNWSFAGLLVSGVAFNLAYFFGRELYNALFVFYFVLLAAAGIALLYFAARGLYRFRHVQRWKIALVSFAVITPFVLFYNPEWFRAETVFRAKLEDDLSRLNLRIRSDGSCSTESVGMLMFSWIHHGQCHIKGDTVMFHEQPYDRDFFPRVAPIRGDKLIIRYRDGEPDTSFASYFQITQRPRGEERAAP